MNPTTKFNSQVFPKIGYFLIFSHILYWQRSFKQKAVEVGGRRRRRRWFLGKPQFILLLQYPHQFFFATTDPGGWCGTNFRHCGTNSAEICSLLDYRKKERETIAATIRVENLHHTSSSCKRQIFPGQIRRRRQNFTDFIFFILVTTFPCGKF